MTPTRRTLRNLRLFLAVASLVSGSALAASTITVNDGSDALHSQGCATTGLGTCTLRDAMTFSNTNPGPDVILFNIPGPGVHTISPLSSLPNLTDSSGVTIDGYSQPGATPNTLLRGDNANLLIEVSGALIPSGFFGLFTIFSDNNTIQGLVINAYPIDSSVGIQGSNNVVTGSFIGTDATGLLARPSRAGVTVLGGTNRIGGSDPASRNVIVGSSLNVLSIGGTGNHVVQGNYVGTNKHGTASLGGLFHGIAVASDQNVIGGSDPGAGNLVSGNGTAFGNGLIVSDQASSNAITGNLVGTDREGVTPLPNGGHGIFVDALSNSNVIAANTIAFNRMSGVRIGFSNDSLAAGNRISANRIWSNGGLGIDLGVSGVNANDPEDVDTGPNRLQNFPTLTLATGSRIVGTLNSAPNTVFDLEFFSSADCDPSGFGEGQVPRGATTVQTNSSGNASFEVTLPLFSGQAEITATATDPGGNTSEFSRCVVAVAPAVEVPSLSPVMLVILLIGLVVAGLMKLSQGS